MSIEILSYNYVSELPALIAEIKKKFAGNQNNLRFVIPSRADKNWWPDSGAQDSLWTWNEIYNDLCSSNFAAKKRILSPPDHLLILDVILKDVLADYPDKVKNLPGLQRPGFLLIISSDIRELLNEAVRPGQLILNPESDNPSEFLLPEVYSRYINYLEEYNLLDSAEVYTASFDEIQKNQEWGKELIIIFTGFLSFTHGQLELVQALRDRCKEVLIVKPESQLKNFYDAGAQFGERVQIKKSSGKILDIPVADPGLEPEVIARQIALNFQENFDGLALSISQGREESFAEAFERYGVPYNFMSGVKISQTLPGKVLSAIRNLYTRNFPAYETAMLLTQSCFAGMKFPVLRAYRNGHSGLDNWEEYLTLLAEDEGDELHEVFEAALLAVKAIKKFCAALGRYNAPEKIMSAFYDFLTTQNLWLSRDNGVAEFQELDESVRLTASAIETIGQKVLALDELLPDLGYVHNKRLRDDDAYEFLERWCAHTNTRASLKISNAVRIFTGPPPVLAAFPVWIMTGVTAKTWSANITSSPLLGTHEREILAENKAYLPMIKDKAVQREALFRRLIQVGEKLTVISRPELDEEGRPVAESPFMTRFLEDMPGWQREQKESSGIKILLGEDGFTFPEIDPGEKIFRAAPVINGKANAVGASDINELFNCPFLWWQKRQSKLFEPNSNIVSPAEWGNLLHKFWERVWRRYRLEMESSGEKFFKIALDEWDNLTTAEELDEEYKNYSRLLKDFRFKRKLQGLEFRVKRLSKVQGEIIDSLHEAGFVHSKILLEEEAHLKTSVKGVTFLGQCDRIEFLKDSQGKEIAFIADYKEGTGEFYEASMKISGYSWNLDGRDKFSYGLQLSLYAALFSKNYLSNKLAGVYILGLENGKISGSFAQDFECYEAFKNFRTPKFNTGLDVRILEGQYAMECAVEILNGKQFSPNYNGSLLCEFCRIKSLCRRGELRGEMLEEQDESEVNV
ncbi:MAG: PD-(D/E)XK nuclease family protein [Synergistaceae bacterium]|nr:PD-(D/E)XK nuclease family protein [Synergistaceae bacterium]